ncbi:hypothetical protein ACJMK2_027768 [Sinanodonta woodiana]|uniref:C-type lectin domain-containing protein n=1 Tax=Sinanodonta woodiana TaxID=1069815 RepID=A0ABD3X4Y6_SINWO
MKIGSITRTLLFLVQFIQVATWCNNTDNFLLNGWKKYDGALYKQFGDPEKNYNSWETYCQSYGGSLATVKNAEENAFVNSIIVFGRSVLYFGLKNDGINWIWNDGTPAIYSNWNKDAAIKQPYACAYLYVNTPWSPTGCHTAFPGGICKCPVAVHCNATNPCSNPYADCTSGICQCRSGYRLSGTRCTAAVGSPCDATNGCFNPYASCVDGYCQCRPGYSKSEDHCKADVGTPCHTYYGCSNIGASCNGTCQCKSGYESNGSICKAVVGAPCDQTNGCSNPYARCTNGICDCMSGYFRNGILCKGALGSACDATNGCFSHHADCHSDTCQCMAGYSQTGTDCKAVVGTACDEINGCSNPYANCTNGICDCMLGYTTNGSICQGALGSTCDAINGCSSPYADCASGTCQCRSGYIQTGTDCKEEPTTPERHQIPVAWIVGGIIAVIVVIILVGIGIFLWRRSQYNKQTRHVTKKDKSMSQEESTNMNPTKTRQNEANGQEYEGHHLTGGEAS